MPHSQEFDRILAYVRDYAPSTDRATLTAELLDAGVDHAMVVRAIHYGSATPTSSRDSSSSIPMKLQLYCVTRRIAISLCLVEMVIQAQPFFLPRGQWPLGLSPPDQSAAGWLTLSVVITTIILGFIGLQARKVALVVAFLPTAFMACIATLASLAFGGSLLILALLPIYIRLPIALTIALTGQPSLWRVRAAIMVFVIHVLVMIGIQHIGGI
jgi:hypothetical protein